MRFMVIPLVLAGSLVGTQNEKKAETTKERELRNFEGQWTVVSQKVDGKALPEDAVKYHRMTVKGSLLTYTILTIDDEATFSINLEKNPKEIDITWRDGGTDAPRTDPTARRFAEDMLLR